MPQVQGGSVIEALGALGLVKAPDARIFVVDPDDTAYTIQDAIDECVDDLGDIIVCLPGSHSEAASIACNKQGITIIASAFGHPDKFKGESFTLRTASGAATVPGVTLTKPCTFIGMGITGRDITKESLLIDCQEAGGFSGGFNFFKNCRFSAWYGAMDALVRQIGGNVNVFDGCTFDGLFGGVGTAGIHLENDTGGFAPNFLRVVNCEFSGMGSGKPAIKCKTGSLPVDMLVANNYLLPGYAGDQGVLIDFNSVAATGMAADNWVAPLANQAAAFLNAGSLSAFGFSDNHYEEA